MTDLFDHRQVRRSFSRAAHGYDQAAALQREVGARLSETLDYLDERVPDVVVDVGCGPGHLSAAMQQRWPRAQVIALDLALPMLREARGRFGEGGWRPRLLGGARRPDPVCADARALPLRDASVDVLFSNLCLQWVEDLPAVFAGFRRVLKPGGLLLVSTFGPDTLFELRGAFAEADAAPHVSPFASIAQFGDALIAAGFKNPVLDRDEFVLGHDDLGHLMRELRTLGATNASVDRRRSLTGRARFARAAEAYEPLRGADGKLPATWEVVYAHAWGPEPGTPIRVGGVDEVQVPASSIRVRQRP
ncbi:malonyl-ACP O-methyltransferase BioC [Lysobacter enzymogenes]|uniref:Malonyl-[acyl-carrier protein] O-methyltransferase n=1 Tax=Lysobacter enzymogenes TaxID=69 RepID=A0A0S2DA45_LYSEN|nr:malonyl-ACP O-methyltransferase BioC [Lysobacter enzymogenes]ALN55424.1 biotin biosynthesis protein BioC [Lysobacter enzymogenes]QCW24505.1 malonyl-ACP O-methyltransferase BioC [Lysobacter enzymogenes]QQQ01256.1 malonyl-ACP O-methyltransferase BioC [Lysobacter enzymogenes]